MLLSINQSFLPSKAIQGLAFCAILAAASLALGLFPSLPTYQVSALTLAIVLGMLLGNSMPQASIEHLAQGTSFVKHYFLRLGIILYGFRLSFADIQQIGWQGIATDALILLSTFSLAVFLGVRLLKLERNSAILIGVGSSICGAAAILAAQGVVKARANEVAIAISTVVFFGTSAIFVYPLLFDIFHYLPFVPQNEAAFGLWVGSSVHEVAQVVATGAVVSPEAANTAVIAKMVRVMMLAPFLLGLAFLLSRPWFCQEQNSVQAFNSKNIPWFAFIFVLMIGVNSFIDLPEQVLHAIEQLDTFLLAMAMAALGLNTHFKELIKAGFKPMLLASILFIWLIVAGGFINLLFN